MQLGCVVEVKALLERCGMIVVVTRALDGIYEVETGQGLCEHVPRHETADVRQHWFHHGAVVDQHLVYPTLQTGSS